MRMKIELTETQREQLRPLFDLVYASNNAGIDCAIGAQVFEDGINVKFFSGDQGLALANALGGNFDSYIVTADQAYQAGIERDAILTPNAKVS